MKVFHTFRLDAANYCLWRGEERVPLAPKAFDVLRYLMEHADRLVTQDEILEALWPETYVNPEVVKKYVLGIRKVLGDQASKPAFVATFPRRGYQFIAPIREETVEARPGSAAIDAIRSMVGREDALTQLNAALSKALQGQRQIVFVTGEAGIGKTMLVDAFHRAAAGSTNVRIARGQCVEGFGGKEAYYPVLEAVGELLRDAADGPIVHSFAKRAPTWLMQFPALLDAEQRETLKKEIIGATRERMVREICEALEAISTQTPLVICLEDLHWVDPSTLDFISALARRRGPARLLLLATYRPAEVIISQSSLKSLKPDLVLHDLSHEIALERLEESDVAEYLEVRFGNCTFPEGFATSIYQHSGGNALFMVTILQEMVKKGVIAQDQKKWTLKVALEDVELNVPETLDQLIDAQFRQLSAVEQRTLRSASVAGDRFSVWAIAPLMEMSADGIEDICEGLAQKLQFVKSAGIYELANGEISSHYDFKHSLYREVLYRRLSEATRAKLHLLLAQRLKAFCDPCEQELATELALHFEEGHDYEQAIQYLFLVAKNAARRFAYRDSIETLNHALELAAKVARGNRGQLEIQILMQIGDTHYALGNMAESAQAFEQAASRAAYAGLGAAQVTALIRLVHPMGLIDVDRAVAAIERAELISADLDDAKLHARAQLLGACARLYYHAWRSQDAELFSRAMEILRRLSGPGPLQYPEMHYAHLHPLQGGFQEALQIADAGILKINETTSTVSVLLAIGAKAVALMHMGQLGDALQVIRAATEQAATNGNDPWLLTIREAWLRTTALDFEGAGELCQTMIRSDSGYPKGQPQAIGWFAAGNVALAHAKFDEAVENFKRVLDKDLTPKFFLHWYWRMQAQLGMANAWLASGDLGSARAEACRLLESALATADPNLQVLAWDLRARVAIAEKNWNDAEESAQKGRSILAKFELPTVAWRLYQTSWDLNRHLKNEATAEAQRKCAEQFVLKLADSFAPQEPLRATFLGAAAVRRIFGQNSANAPRRRKRRQRSGR
jgi:DNA-binding winged helix-turn-helix (wHTH) protein/tetratricopeptide (TPR) repeat protein